jgi:hypothetical protein
MSPGTTARWLRFLNPESLKQNLIRASIYITCWELLKESVIGRPKDFFTHKWSASGEGKPSPAYKTNVLSLHRDPLIASALWFRNRQAVSDGDIELLKSLKKHRNEIAHELPKFLGQADCEVRLDFLSGAFLLVEKIDKWWIQNVEIPTNPDFAARVFTDEELNNVTSARMICMNLIISVANGDEEGMRQIYEGLRLHVEREAFAPVIPSADVPDPRRPGRG